MNWLAIDIGGANLKAADGLGYAVSEPFALWQQSRKLADALRAVIAGAPKADHIALTMTGELADCFATKTEGVTAIVQALVTAVDGRHARVYLTDGKIVAPQIALRQPLLAAASNWHVLARFAGRFAPLGCSLMVDVGSTTCDIIPLNNGKPVGVGRTDTERLLCGELIYTGVVRSPICGVVNMLPYRGKTCPVAQELFATTYDAYLLSGELPEDSKARFTADGRPGTKAHARDRMARMICADRDTFTEDDATTAAQAVSNGQLSKLIVAAGQVLAGLPQRPSTVIISGQGEFLARRLITRLALGSKVVSLAQEIGDSASHCAPAHALAVIAREGAA